MLPTIPRRINSVTETRSRVVTPNITRATNERCYISPRRSLSPPLTDITYIHGCKFVTVLAHYTRNGPMMRSMAASSDFDVISREKERVRGGGTRREREKGRGRRGGTGGHFVDNVFQRRQHGNVRRIDIRSTPRGGRWRPEGARAMRGTAVVRVKRDETTGLREVR